MMTSRIGPPAKDEPGHGAGDEGVSLIELILVMAVLAIVAAIVVPRLSGFSSGREYEGEWNRLKALLRYARSEAVARSTPVEISFDTIQGSYRLVGGYGLEDLPANTLEHMLPKGLAFAFPDDSTQTDGSASILFRPDGSVDDESPKLVQLVERNGEFQRTLQQDPVFGYTAATSVSASDRIAGQYVERSYDADTGKR